MILSIHSYLVLMNNPVFMYWHHVKWVMLEEHAATFFIIDCSG